MPLMPAGPVWFSMTWFCAKRVAKGRANSASRLCPGRTVAQQEQRRERGQAERGGDDEDAAAHHVDQEAEQQRRRGLRHPRRRADDAKAIAVILRTEDRERQRAACNREDSVAGAVKDR